MNQGSVILRFIRNTQLGSTKLIFECELMSFNVGFPIDMPCQALVSRLLINGLNSTYPTSCHNQLEWSQRVSPRIIPRLRGKIS